MKINKEILQDYIDGRLPEKENEAVQAWIADNTDNPELNAFLLKIFDGSRVEAGASDMASLSALHKRLGRRRLPRTAVFLAAAVAALLIVLPLSIRIGYRLHKEPSPVAWQEISVPVAQTRDLTLPDGTTLTLNAGTSVICPNRFDGESREIFLDGEVFAQVAKDPEHPFIIHSNGVDVRVLGTTFNLRSFRNSDVVETVLIEGSVRMDVPSGEGRREVSLTPGDIAQWNRTDEQVTLGRFSSDNYKPGGLSFYNLPLKDIVSELERHFGTEIVIADSRLSSRRFLAFFTNGENLDEILTLLSRNGDMKVTRRNGTIYLYHK